MLSSPEPRKRSPFLIKQLFHENKTHADLDISALANERECKDALIYFTNRSHKVAVDMSL